MNRRGGIFSATTFSVIFYKEHRNLPLARGAFTLVEAVVAVSLIGVGIASTLTALTKINSMASMSRNSTGAYTVVMNQIDLIQSDGPFNPQKKDDANNQLVPPSLVLGTHTPVTVDIYKEPPPPFPGNTTTGSTTIVAAGGAFNTSDVNRVIVGAGIPTGATIVSVTNGTTVVISAAATATATTSILVPARGVIVSGTMTTTITDASPNPYVDATTPGLPPYLYRATVTVTYNYLGAVAKAPYSFSMSTLRASDI